MTDPLANIATLTARVAYEAMAWCDANPPGLGEVFGDELRPLREAVAAFQAACQPRALTWGQVPAGWEVLAPNGQWYTVEATRQTGHGTQAVMMLGKTWSRDPAGPVTARPGAVDATDVAIAVLGYPDVLKDGR